MTTSTERNRDRRAKRKALGLCIECPRPALPGKVRCDECHEDSLLMSSVSHTRKILAAGGTK